MASESLLAICRHFTKETMAKLENNDDDPIAGMKALDFPFDVEAFCRENDQRLEELRRALIGCGMNAGRALVAIREANRILTCPAAEYVPQIPQSWALLTQAEKALISPPLPSDAVAHGHAGSAEKPR